MWEDPGKKGRGGVMEKEVEKGTEKGTRSDQVEKKKFCEHPGSRGHNMNKSENHCMMSQ